MDTRWLSVITRIQDVSMLVALIIFLVTPKVGRKNFLTIGIILGFGFVIEITAWIGYRIFHLNPNPVGLVHAYLIVPLFFFFYKPKIRSKRVINLFIVIVVAYLSLALINTIFFQTINILPSYTLAAQSAVLITFSLIYFFTLRKELPRQVYIALPIFWINCAVIIYYSVLLPIYLVTDYIYMTLKLSIIPLWMMHNSAGILYYTFLAVGLWRNRALYTPQSSLKG